MSWTDGYSDLQEFLPTSDRTVSIATSPVTAVRPATRTPIAGERVNSTPLLEDRLVSPFAKELHDPFPPTKTPVGNRWGSLLPKGRYLRSKGNEFSLRLGVSIGRNAGLMSDPPAPLPTAPMPLDTTKRDPKEDETTREGTPGEGTGTGRDGNSPSDARNSSCTHSKGSTGPIRNQPEEPVVMLYHESQVASLCGMHCLNALLQGPAFNEWDLGMVAQEVDEAERKLMAEGGVDTQEYAEFLVKQSEDSENVSSDGNFSLQVLHKALEVWGIKVSPLQSVHGAVLEIREAFLCLTSNHWFAIRKVGGAWYNFNSKLPAPAEVAEDSLLAYLTAMIENPHQSVFDVEGRLPVVGHENANESGTWMTPLDAREILQHEPPETFHTAWALGGGPDEPKEGECLAPSDILHLKVHAIEDLFLDMDASRVSTVHDFLKDVCHVLGLEHEQYTLETGNPRTVMEKLDASLEEEGVKEGQVIFLVRKVEE